MPTSTTRPRLFRNALCLDGCIRDLGVLGGSFVDPERLVDTDVVDLDGLLVLPGFVEGHIHLDKSFVGDRWRPHCPAAGLSERLTIEKELLAEALPVTERADALLAQAHRLGTIAMRSHVDIDASLGLSHLHAVIAATAPWQGRVDVEIVAFPQAGILASPGTADLLDAQSGKALALSAVWIRQLSTVMPTATSMWCLALPNGTASRSTSIFTSLDAKGSSNFAGSLHAQRPPGCRARSWSAMPTR